MDIFTWLWIGWLGYFGLVETLAIARSSRAKQAGHPNPRDTLSEHVWLWFGTDKATQPNTWAYLRRLALLAFLTWAAVHLLGGGQLI